MHRSLLATLLLTLALPLAAAEVRELTWSEMVPADAPPQVTEPAPIHDLSQLAAIAGRPSGAGTGWPSGKTARLYRAAGCHR